MILLNTESKPFKINVGNKISQGTFYSTLNAEKIQPSLVISTEKRNSKGFECSRNMKCRQITKNIWRNTIWILHRQKKKTQALVPVMPEKFIQIRIWTFFTVESVTNLRKDSPRICRKKKFVPRAARTFRIKLIAKVVAEFIQRKMSSVQDVIIISENVKNRLDIERKPILFY